MKRARILLAVLALALVISTLAAPAFSRSNFSGDQQYGYCDNCHSAVSPLTVTMTSTPSAANPIAPGATVTVSVSVSGSVNGATQMGALIASTTGATNSLPSNGGWTITSDPSGGTFNYYKTSSYTSQYTFTWTLTAPTTSGVHPLYGRALHSGSQEYYKNAGPLNFNVQSTPVGSPTVTITSPMNGATISGSTIVTGTAVAASGASIASVVLNVDGAQRGTTTSSTFSFSLDTTTLLNGLHTLQVVTTDDGARTGSQSITVTTNNAVTANPVVQITAPSNGQMVTGAVNVNAAVTPGQGATIQYVQFSIGTVQFGNDTSSPYSASLDTTAYADGAHTITVRAVDNGGRIGSQTITVVINNTGTAQTIPIVTITSPTNGASASGTFMVNATVVSARQLTSVDLLVDGVSQGPKTAAPYSWAINSNTLSPGSHNLNVTATDNTAITGYQLVTVNIIGFVGPIVQFERPTAGGEFEGPMIITANVTGSGLSYVLLFVDGQQVANNTVGPFTWQINTANYLDGSLVINVTAVDQAGKRGFSEITVSIDNAGQDEPLIELATTIVAGVLGIIALVMISTTAVMFFRAKKGGGI